jgi:twitching motility protein PilT
MKRLKKILKEAITNSGHIVRISVGSKPQVEKNSEITVLADCDIVGFDFLEILYRELFDNGETIIKKQEPCKGKLLVNSDSGKGDYLLLAIPQERALLIALPQHPESALALERAWSSVMGAASSKTVPPSNGGGKLSDSMMAQMSAPPKVGDAPAGSAKLTVPTVSPPSAEKSINPAEIGSPKASSDSKNEPLISKFSMPSPSQPAFAVDPAPQSVPFPHEGAIVKNALTATPVEEAGLKAEKKQPAMKMDEVFSLDKEILGAKGANHASSFISAGAGDAPKPQKRELPAFSSNIDNLNDVTNIPFQADLSSPAILSAGARQESDRRAGLADVPANALSYSREDFQSAAQENAGIEYGAKIGLPPFGSAKRPIDEILLDMLSRRASDLHLMIGEPACMRIDGDMIRVADRVVSEQLMASYIDPIIPTANKKEFIETNDTDFAYEIAGKARFRVNVFRDKNGVGAVLRQIPGDIPSAEQLGLPPAILKLCDYNKGLVLVTGPTGSGKSTTLAAMIDYINRNRAKHIITIEDPIEFTHQQKKCLINQRQVHFHTKSFSRALRATLREDPDIVLIGEMRDLETIAIALETSETGHLVFGTLHTNTAIATIDRIIDQFPTDQQEQVRVMLAETLIGVVAQTLLKKKTGGRVAAMEVLVSSHAVKANIREKKTHMLKSILQTKKSEGNILMNESLVDLVRRGIVDPQEAYLKAIDKAEFMAMMQQAGIPFKGDPGQAA